MWKEARGEGLWSPMRARDEVYSSSLLPTASCFCMQSIAAEIAIQAAGIRKTSFAIGRLDEGDTPA